LLRQAASDSAGGCEMSVIGAGMRMMAAGLNMRQVHIVSRDVMAHEVWAYARAHVGAETVTRTVVAIPGLWRFM
jgi:hypothetical protein